MNKLKAAFNGRIAKSEDFRKDLERIQKYKEQKERDSVSLNEEKFFARRKELSADKEDEENFKKVDDGNEVVIDLEDHYNQEILQVTLDYMQLLSGSDISATAQR